MPVPFWFAKLRALLTSSLQATQEQLGAGESSRERSSRKIQLRQLEDRVLIERIAGGRRDDPGWGNGGGTGRCQLGKYVTVFA